MNHKDEWQSHDLWLEKVTTLNERCRFAEAVEAPGLARALFAIVCDAPEPLGIFLGTTCDRERFEALLQHGALECAILQMYGANVGYMLSRGANGQAAVTLSLPGLVDEEVCFSSVLSIAMIGCLCQAFIKGVRSPGNSPLTATRNILN